MIHCSSRKKNDVKVIKLEHRPFPAKPSLRNLLKSRNPLEKHKAAVELSAAPGCRNVFLLQVFILKH